MQLRSGKIIQNSAIDFNNLEKKFIREAEKFQITPYSVSITKKSLILNLNTNEYFMATSKTFYIKRMRELLSVPEKPLLDCDKTESHWRRTDRVIIVPIHLENHVKKNFAELFLEYRLN